MKSVVWMSAILALLFLSPAFAQDGPPNLTGKWVLNNKMSDDFAEVMKETRGGRGNGDRDADRQAQNQERLDRALEEYSRLEIFRDGIELNVTNGLDITRLLYTDGREMAIWTQRGEARATAIWQDQMLLVEWKSGHETLSLVRKYSLTDQGQKLTMRETLNPPGPDKAIDITMVYDLEK